jgi:hypothetical protein
MFNRYFVTVFLAASLVSAVRADEPKKEPKLPAFTAPKGWTALEGRESDKTFGLVVKRFRIGDGDKASGVVVTALPGNGGGLVNNVNRWRNQVGLQGLDEKDALKSLTPIKVDGRDAHLLDVTEPDGEKVKRAENVERIVAVVVVHDGQTVFVKLSGPAKAVGDQKKVFDEFVKSIRFEK